MSDTSLTLAIGQFNAARDAYRDARNEQRKFIADALKAAGFTVKSHGAAGRGLAKYTSGRRLDPPFNLSNWMWVEGCRNDIIVLVTLQTLDQDPNSMNVHALIDRVGIDVFRESDTVVEDPLYEYRTSSFQLPLSDESLAQLIARVEQNILGLL